MVEYGLERKVSEHSSLAVSMTVGVPTGVMLKIKYAFVLYYQHHQLQPDIFTELDYLEATKCIISPFTCVTKSCLAPYSMEQ